MTTHSLSTWIGEQQVGTLSYHDDTGRFSFEYEQTWMTHSGAYPISPALPLRRPDNQTDELHSVNVRRFFENLLPEGKALEDAAAAHTVSKGNLFGLLRWLGQESTGALALLPEGTLPARVEPSVREVAFEELSERIHDRANRPFTVWDGRVRMSIAGAKLDPTCLPPFAKAISYIGRRPLPGLAFGGHASGLSRASDPGQTPLKFLSFILWTW